MSTQSSSKHVHVLDSSDDDNDDDDEKHALFTRRMARCKEIFNKEKWATAKVYIQPVKSTSSSITTTNACVTTTSSYVSSTSTPPPASKTPTTPSSSKTTNTPNTIPPKRGRGRPRKELPSDTHSNKRLRTEPDDHKLDTNTSLSLSSSTSPTSSIRALDDGDDDNKSDMMIIEDHHYHIIYVNQASMAIASPKWHTMFNNNWMESKQKQIILEAENKHFADVLYSLVEFVHTHTIHRSIIYDADKFNALIYLADEHDVEYAFEYIHEKMKKDFVQHHPTSYTIHKTIVDHFQSHPSSSIQKLKTAAISQCLISLERHTSSSSSSSSLPPSCGCINHIVGVLAAEFSPLDNYVLDDRLMMMKNIGAFVALMNDGRLMSINEAAHFVTCLNYVQRNVPDDNTPHSNAKIESIIDCVRFPVMSSTFLVYLLQDVTIATSIHKGFYRQISSRVNSALCYHALPLSIQQEIIQSSGGNKKFSHPQQWTLNQLTGRNTLDSNILQSLYNMDFTVTIPEADLKLADSDDMNIDGEVGHGGCWDSANHFFRGGWKWTMAVHREKDANDNQVYAGAFLRIGPCMDSPSLSSVNYGTKLHLTCCLQAWNWSLKNWVPLFNFPKILPLNFTYGRAKAFRSKRDQTSYIQWHELLDKNVCWVMHERQIRFRVELKEPMHL